MISKCQCMNCGQNVEFDSTEFERSGESGLRVLGQRIVCPHCGKETVLYFPKEPEIKVAEIKAQLRLIPCDVCNHPISPNAMFCFQCGEFHYGLFRTVFFVVCYIGLAGAILTFIGLLIDAAYNTWVK